MPNWCETTYKCVGDKEQIKSLYGILKKITRRKKQKISNGFGKLWLGELVNELGFDWERYRCRGEITDFNLQDGILTINQETAWCEQEGVRQAIEQKFPSIKVYYCAEEPGCEVYCTNDKDGQFFSDRYYLDAYEDPQYFETIEEAARFVTDLVGKKVAAKVSAIEAALDEYAEIKQENDEDVFYSFHEFQVVDD